ncbi:TPA_asm: G [Anthurium amnicola virus 1]|uniref:G n=2 Tax=root TaxID=1 RepID=A0A8D9PGT3_9RHAB|nr:G [Anthurium amnicola virus 1] [Anthurium amnicola virus 1]DAF42313.1 TPA_asm: G [Anthurium amnicola virus 1]
MDVISLLELSLRLIQSYSTGEILQLICNLLVMLILIRLSSLFLRLPLTLLIIILLVLTISSRNVYGDDHVSLPPAVLCDKNPPEKGDIVESCLTRCNALVDTNKLSYVRIYEYTGESIPYASCRKVIIEKTATETWTFSQLPITTKISYSTVSKTDCLNAWEKECGRKSCHVTYRDFTPQYRWASNTIETREFIEIDATKQGVEEQIKRGHVFRTGGLVVDFKDGGYLDGNKGDIIVWQTKESKSEDCKWKLSSIYQGYTTQESNILCPGIGEVLKIKDMDYLPKNCPSMVLGMTRTGVAYDIRETLSDTEKKILKEDKRPILKASDPAKLDLVADAVRMAMNLDYQRECIGSCYHYDPSKSGIPQLVGGQLMFIEEGNKKKYECSYNPFCKLLHPIRHCAESNLIMINCDGRQNWLNLSTTVASPSYHCSRISTSLPVLIPTWHGVFSLQEGGLVYNKSGLFGEFPRANIPHIISPIKDFNSGLDGITSKLVDSDSKTAKTSGIDIFLFTNVLLWLRRASHYVKVMIVSIFLAIVLIISLVMYLNIAKPLKQRYYQGVEMAERM